MINFSKINLKNKDTLIPIFVFSTLLFFFNNLDIKVLVSILVIILINQSSSIQESIQENLINNKENSPLNYNHTIEDILKKIKKKYKKKSPYNYKEGMYYWKKFIQSITKLEDETLFHYNQHFENAHLYLQKSVNLFQSLGVESHERKFIEGAEYNDFTNSKELKEITTLSKELYHEGYLLLYNLSLRLNQKWKENPHAMNKEIIFDYPLPNDNNNDQHYDFY